MFTSITCVLLASTAYSQTYTVPGNAGRNWVAGPNLPPGTLIQLSASGGVNVGSGRGVFSPEGTTRLAASPGYPAETGRRYSLVARLTSSATNPADDLREEWSYGERHEYCAARGGHLWLTVNDNNAADNTGAFVVVLTRASCPAESTRLSSPIVAYTQKDRTYVRSQRFTVGETVILRVENNSPDPIYFESAPSEREVHRGEDVIVQRLNGSDWVNAVGLAYFDESPVRCIQFRGRMNITRSWTRALGAGTYRLQFTYNTNPAQCADDGPGRTGIARIYSENFEVVAR